MLSTDRGQRGGVFVCERGGSSYALTDGDGATANLPRHKELHRRQTGHGR